MKQDMIVILDMGSTENTVLARQIRELGVYSEIHPHDITADELKALDNVKGIILNGGENRVVDGVPVEIRPDLISPKLSRSLSGWWPRGCLCSPARQTFRSRKSPSTVEIANTSNIKVLPFWGVPGGINLVSPATLIRLIH